jgi:hypothetical protein
MKTGHKITYEGKVGIEQATRATNPTAGPIMKEGQLRRPSKNQNPNLSAEALIIFPFGLSWASPSRQRPLPRQR